MSEEKNKAEETEEVEERTRISSSDEDFTNTLMRVRNQQDQKHKAEKEELQDLTKRLAQLQQRLSTASIEVKRERAKHEVELLERIITCANRTQSFDTDGQLASGLVVKAIAALDGLLDREFPSNTDTSK